MTELAQSDLRVALVHYWFVGRRGGERVVEAISELFPQADLFALIADRSTLSPQLQSRKLTTSFLQNIPFSRKLHRHLLPLYPLAVEQLDLRGYDLVISTESGPAKGVLTSPETLHICYCFTPMRYLWNFYHDYKSESGLGWMWKTIFGLTSHYVRMWDFASAARVDHFVAISHAVAARISKYYRRESEVIHAPVDVGPYMEPREIEDYYLSVGQLVRYKRVDLAIEACNRLERPLRIVGVGEGYKSLKRIAGKTITFLGGVSDDEVRKLYSRCRALIFPGEEDFGIVPIEAQAAGRPVIAFGKGGTMETIAGFDPHESATAQQATGIFFEHQTVDSLAEAIQRFESLEHQFSPVFIHSHAVQFAKANFQRKLAALIDEKLQHHRASLMPPKNPGFLPAAARKV